MKKTLYIILCVFIISSFLVCVNVDQVLGYEFEIESGLFETGEKTGHFVHTIDLEEGNLLTLPGMIGRIIGAALAFLGVVFLILMIYGGYIWMMARGNEQEVVKAKDIIKNSLIGLIVVLAAYAITVSMYAYIGA